MNFDLTLFKLLDDYRKGLLSQEEIKELKERMDNDPAFKRQADSYLELVDAIKFYGDREALKKDLDKIHDEMVTEGDMRSISPVPGKTSVWKKYWPMTAVAASVAFLSILGTIFITQSLETKQTA